MCRRGGGPGKTGTTNLTRSRGCGSPTRKCPDLTSGPYSLISERFSKTSLVDSDFVGVRVGVSPVSDEFHTECLTVISVGTLNHSERLQVWGRVGPVM